MQQLVIVDTFQVVEDRRERLLVGLKTTLVNQLRRERCKETLHQRIFIS